VVVYLDQKIVVAGAGVLNALERFVQGLQHRLFECREYEERDQKRDNGKSRPEHHERLAGRDRDLPRRCSRSLGHREHGTNPDSQDDCDQDHRDEAFQQARSQVWKEVAFALGAETPDQAPRQAKDGA
jgi:hypothetical protein